MDTLAPNVKRLFENYVGEFPDRHIFAEALAEAARRNCCLVINKRSRSPDLYDSVFLFAPQELWLSSSFFGDKNFEWVHQMFFSEKKFNESLSGGGGGSLPEAKSKKGKKPAIKPPPSKSFSIESIEKKKTAAKKGGGKVGKKGGGQPTDWQPPAEDAASWDDDEFDPERDRQQKEQRQVKQNVVLLREKLKMQGRQGQLQAKEREHQLKQLTN